MKTIIFCFFLLISTKSFSNQFEDGFTYTVLDSNIFYYNYWGVNCINENDCLFLARRSVSGALIYKTIDGGKKTNIVYYDSATKGVDGEFNYIPDYRSRYIFYFKSGIAYVMTNPNIILKSMDFGETWRKIYSPIHFNLSGGVIPDEKNAFAVSEKNLISEYEVYYSNDSCETWNLFPTPDSVRKKGFPVSINAQSDKSLLIGYFELGKSGKEREWYFYKTDYNGNKWELLNTPPFTDEVNFINGTEWIARGTILDTIGFREYVVVHKSTDAGLTWELKFKSESPFKESSISIFSQSGKTGYVLGPKNLILKTKDYGENWYFIKDSLIYLGPNGNITGACMPSENTLYFTTTQDGRIVKYSYTGTDVNESLIKTKNIFPNPISGGGTFTSEYEILKSGHFRQYISDTGGREISELFSGFAESGFHSDIFKLPENLSSGAYWLVSEMSGYCNIQMLNVVK